ncbi:MAG: DUF5671 domain-containing protein [Thermomicrobium sp.]|nr:DUF5671 domain-containing protein [Thermomicrobium sp.]
MTVARRLYLYVVTGIALAVWAIGTVQLLRTLGVALWEVVAQPPAVGDPESLRRQLSLGIALLVVGLPIWAVHWWLVQGGAASDEHERKSAIRALFLTLVLLQSFGFWLSAGIELTRQVLLGLLGIAEPAAITVPRALDELTVLLVAGTVWLGHARLARAEHRTLDREGAAAWLPRLYGYGAAATGLTLLILGIANLLQTALDALLTPGAVAGTLRFPLASYTALSFGGLVGWGVHWSEAIRLVTQRHPAADRERRSLVRWTYLGSVVFATVVGMLVAAASCANEGLRWLLGAPDGTASQRLRDMLDPLTWALPFVFVWWQHRRIMRREAAIVAAHPQVGPDWAVGVARLLLYLSTFAGLLLGLFGLGNLVGLFLRVLVAVVTGTTFGEWRGDLALAVSTGVVGGGAWAVSWREVVARTATAVTERTSVSRRVYLFGTLGLSVLVVLGTAGAAVYQLVAALLGVLPFAVAASEAAPTLGFTLVALAVLVMHALVLAEDTRAVAAHPATRTVRLVLRVPAETDPEKVVQELATHLPPGAVLERAR